MRPFFWCVALAATTFAATFAAAQQRVPANNPLSRTETPFFRAFPLGPLDSVHGTGAANAMARPGAHFASVTPVPEPSEWLMMVAGLGLVGLIVRRGARRP